MISESKAYAPLTEEEREQFAKQGYFVRTGLLDDKRSARAAKCGQRHPGTGTELKHLFEEAEPSP